jgi:hypothetical protein
MPVLPRPEVLGGTALPESLARPTRFLGSTSGASRRALRRAVVLLALTPLTLLLGTRRHNLTIDPLLDLYAAVMLATLSGVIYLGFARYSDPSTKRLLGVASTISAATRRESPCSSWPQHSYRRLACSRS